LCLHNLKLSSFSQAVFFISPQHTFQTSTKDLNQWKALYKRFLLILWDERYHEKFEPANLSEYRVRTDFEFVNFPHVPEMWKQAQYAENS